MAWGVGWRHAPPAQGLKHWKGMWFWGGTPCWPHLCLIYPSSMPHLCLVWGYLPPLSSSHATPRPPNEPFFGTSGIETIIQCPDFFSGTPRTDFSVGFEVRSRKSTPTWNSEKSKSWTSPRNRGFCPEIPRRKKGKPWKSEKNLTGKNSGTTRCRP